MKTAQKIQIPIFFTLVFSLLFSCSDNSSSDPSGSTTTPQYAYITDGNDLKIIDVAVPTAPTFVSSLAVNTSYFVSVSPNVAYVAQYDATAPYLSLIDLSNANAPVVSQTVPKNSGLVFRLLSDMYTINNIGYLTDTYGGFYVIDLANSNFNLQVNLGADAMSLTKIQNELFVIDQASGLHSYNVSTPGNPVLTGTSNTSDIDAASYADSPFGQYHSWVETDGTYLYVANTIDKKIKQFDAATLTLVNEVLINGYPTAFALHDGHAFVTMKASSNAPLQASYDGVKMYDLATLSLVDMKPLNQASGIALNNNQAYVTDADGLHIYDVSGNNFLLQATLAAGFGNFIALGQ
ncbi:LVIVD repeat-containing protein [Bizionia argentinensis]|nr:LVIVD repeat family protein [Bizionia argentinensis]